MDDIARHGSPDGSRVREVARFRGARSPGRGGRLTDVRWSWRMQVFKRASRPPWCSWTPKRTLPQPVRSGALRSPQGVAWVDGASVVYSQPAVALGLYTSTSSAIVLQDVRSSRARTLFTLPLDARMVDVLGPGRLVFGARSFQGSLREVALQPAASAQGRWLTEAHRTTGNRYTTQVAMDVLLLEPRGNLTVGSHARRAPPARTEDAAEDWLYAFKPEASCLEQNRTGAFERGTAEAEAPAHAGPPSRRAGKTVAADGEWIL